MASFPTPSSQRPTVVVTGASTGIGAATVQLLDQQGFHVWASVRQEVDAERLIEESAGRVSVLRLDVTDADAVRAAGEQVCAAGPLWGLVNNAGVALPGPLEQLPIDVLRQQLEVNLIGHLAVTQAMLPAIRSGRGRIVMVGSILGRIAVPVLGAYCTSKFGLTGLSDTLRAELAPWGLKVILIEPGAIATPIWQRGRTTGDKLAATLPAASRQLYARQMDQARTTAEQAAARGLHPDAVARVILRALTEPRPRPRYLVGRDARFGALIARLPHRLQYRLLAARP